MTYPEFILKNFMMTDAEINAHYLADCRRVNIESKDALNALFTRTWNQASLAIVLILVRDVRRMN